MMRHARALRSVLAAIVLTALAPAAWVSASTAAEPEKWLVSGKLEGKKGKKAEDISGIACSSIPPRECLVIDDETQFAQWVTIGSDGLVAGPTLPLIDDRDASGKPVELDGEGVAYADGAFFVTGSFGAARKPGSGENDARVKASSHVFRITPENGTFGIEGSGALRDIILADPELAPFADGDLADNGLTVEGIAVLGDTSYIGFRGPVLDGGESAAILELPTATLFGSGEGRARLRKLPLGTGRGVRDLSAVGDEILVLAGPMANADAGSAAPGAYSLYRWDPRQPDPAAPAAMTPLLDIPGFSHESKGKPDKPEAVLPLEVMPGSLKLLILFDGPKEGAPRAFTVDW